MRLRRGRGILLRRRMLLILRLRLRCLVMGRRLLLLRVLL